MVFQSYALYPHLTVLGNIVFPAEGPARARAPSARRRRSWAADLLGIGHLLDRRPRELSGGERQRVALARAIVREPTRLPARRAPLEPRREAARLGAGGARAVPAPRRDDHDLRHARPGRGDGDGRPRRRDAPGRRAPDRHAGRGLRRSGRHLRRHLPRLASDEPRRERGGGRRVPARALPSGRQFARRLGPWHVPSRFASSTRNTSGPSASSTAARWRAGSTGNRRSPAFPRAIARRGRPDSVSAVPGRSTAS